MEINYNSFFLSFNNKIRQILSTIILAVLIITFIAQAAYGQSQHELYNKNGEKLLPKQPVWESPKEGIAALNRAIPWFEKAENWEQVVTCLNDLFIGYCELENFDSCLIISKRAFDVSVKSLQDSSSALINATSNLGVAYKKNGLPNRTLQLYAKALELEEKHGKSKLDRSISLSNIGILHTELGDYDQAYMYYEKSYDLTVEELGLIDHETAYIVQEMATCQKNKGNSTNAINGYRECLNILDKLEKTKWYDQTRWYAYIGMAEIYLKLGNKGKVLEYANKAIKLDAQYNLLEDFKTWALFGKLYQTEGNYPLALENFAKQKIAAEKEYPNYRNHPQKALAISNMASVYADMGDYQKSLQHYHLALQTIAAGFNSNDLGQNPAISQLVNKSDALDILSGKAATLVKAYKAGGGNLSNLKAAHQCYSLLTSLVNNIRQGYLAEGSKHALSERVVDIYEQAIEVALELNRSTGKKEYLEDAFAFAESNKAVLLFESIRDQMAKGFAGIPDSLLEQERDLQAQITFHERKILESQQKLTPDEQGKLKAWEGKLFELREQRNKLNKLLETRYPNYYELKYQTGPASIAAIRQKMGDDDSALVEFMLGPNKGYAFFLTQDDLAVHEITDRAAIAGQLSRLREILTTPPSSDSFARDFSDFSHHAFGLYNSLLAQGMAKFNKEIERLIIVPDGELSALPFEVLLRKAAKGSKPNFSPKQLDYLFEGFAISYHYSATLLANSHQLENKELSFLGFAPKFGDGLASNSRSCTGNDLSSLSCNQQEVESIQLIMGGRAILSDYASTKAFLLDAPNCGILHLATHACIDEAASDLNKIFFSDDYIPQIDLDQLRLRAALTVLSACNTGTGRLQQGEGVLSMARSFLLAGSASVLTSLWAVDDCTTSDIMVHFYELLKKGKAKDVAIQQARLDYLKSADAEGSHPYYWAAFVQFGDVEPLVKRNPYLPFLLGTGILAIASLFFLCFRQKRSTPMTNDGAAN